MLVGLAVGALALGLSPNLGSASAADPPPAVSFVDYGATGSTYWQLKSAAPDGSAPQLLTPAGYMTYRYDVSQDGNTMILGVARGAVSAVGADRTYGLVLVRRVAGVTTSRMLTNFWDTNPVLSPDGATAWWISGGKVWKYTAGVTTLVTASLFAPRYGETIAGFAVSPDGTHGAVAYREDGVVLTSTYSRLFAADFVAGTSTDYLDWSANLKLGWAPLVWANATSLIYGYWDGVTWLNGAAALSSSGGTGLAPPPADLTGMYDIRLYGTDWWAWLNTTTTTDYATSPDLAGLATATFNPRIDGVDSEWHYTSAVTPPALTSAVNRATTHPYLYLSVASTLYGKKAVYDSWAEYLTALPGETFANDATWTARGTLQYSINGTTWRALTTTTWAHPVPWPGSTYKAAGYTQVLTRNTWYRWIYPGDYLTTPSTSRTVLVKVVPIVKAKVTVSGTKRIVSGSATRIGGSAVLYKVVGTKLIKVATTTLTSKGLYNFGRRSLAHGTYRVTTVADRYWAAGSVRFGI